jgi:hypothetical protein
MVADPNPAHKHPKTVLYYRIQKYRGRQAWGDSRLLAKSYTRTRCTTGLGWQLAVRVRNESHFLAYLHKEITGHKTTFPGEKRTVKMPQTPSFVTFELTG